jgi:carbon-monoxide dehydrogenase large subunit
MERVLDAIADQLGLSRVEVRRRNLVPLSAMPYATPMRARSTSQIVYDSGDFHACLEKALRMADFEGFEARRRAALAQGRRIGFGVATGIKGTGRGPFESATVRVGRSGKISIYTGAMPMGQGLKTVLAQIAADELGVTPDDITVICGDTSTIQLGLGGFASRQTVTAGSSVKQSAAAVREKALAVAALMLDVPADDLAFREGRVWEKGKNVSLSLGDIADTLAGAPGYNFPAGTAPGLEASENFVLTALTYGLGVHAVELEVDVRTGGVKLLRYAVVTDCGTVINPMMAEGQIHGGVVHGIGNALFEWMGYDDQGQPFTTTLAEYLLPTAPDIPHLDIALEEYPTKKNPLGVKGIGEAGTVPAAPAIMSAIEDALREEKVKIAETPISPSRIFELLAQARAAR